MLELLLGTDWVSNRDEILRRVTDDIRNRKTGIVLIVPELISHDMERRLCSFAGDTASRYAEVLTFTRLASRVAEDAGFAALQCMDNGGRVVAMAAAARQLHNKLKAYASLETKPEFLTGLLDAVDEFKRCCITSNDLKEASLKSEGAFAQKLEELSLLLEAYDSLCQRGKRDPGDQMNWVLEQLENNGFASKHTFYIDGFPDFTRQHFSVIEHLISNAQNVTLSLTCDRQGSNAMAFEKAGHTASELIRAAERLGVAYRVNMISPNPGPIAEFRGSLFQGDMRKNSVAGNVLSLYHTDDIHAECNNAATCVMELVRSGERYREIGIACTDMSAYRHALEAVFARCSIPVYLAGTEDIMQNTVISTVFSALEAALSGFDRQDILRYLKSNLSPLDSDIVDQMENYAIMWGISGNKWTEPWKYHPCGLGADETEDSLKLLSVLEEARKLAILPLITLRNAFNCATKLDDQVNGLRSFFEDISFSERMCDLAETMEAEGDPRSAQIMNQLWEIMLGALDQLQDTLGETVWDNDSFLRLFSLLLNQYDVGTIPPVLDAVTIGPISTMRCHQVSHLIILGAQEGAFPGYSGSNGVLTDQERLVLRTMGIGLTGGGMEGLQAEFADIYGLFCAANKTVTLSYHGKEPSYVYRRLLTMSGFEQPGKFFVSPNVKDVAATLAERKDIFGAKMLGIMEEYAEIDSKKQYHLGKISDSNIKRLYGNVFRLSASQVDRQAECRLAYFFNYGLHAKERKEITVDPAEFGTFVHAVLEHSAREVMERGGFHKVSLDDTLKIAKHYSEEYARERFGELESSRVAYLFQRNATELDAVVTDLWEELSQSLFEPAEFELGFGDRKAMPAISITGDHAKAVLRGYVDRIDIWNDGEKSFFRVVDYKTGSKDFDYCDVFNGVGLQMLLYLFALEEVGHHIVGEDSQSAGVQYFPARTEVITAKGKPTEETSAKMHADKRVRKGLLLADLDVMSAMEPGDAFRWLPCKITKDGSLQGDLATEDQLRMLKDYVFRLLGNLIDEIASGNVEPYPYVRGIDHGICSWCPYKTVCHAMHLQSRRVYKAMNSQRFWEEIGKEMECHG